MRLEASNNCASLAKNFCYMFSSSCCVSFGIGKAISPDASST